MFRFNSFTRPLRRRRRMSSPALRQWRAVLRRQPLRWLMLVAPIALLASLGLMLLADAPNAREIAQAWELAGRIGVVVVTAVIGRAMLNHGR